MRSDLKAESSCECGWTTLPALRTQSSPIVTRLLSTIVQPSSNTRRPIRTPYARQARPLNGVPSRLRGGRLDGQLPVALVPPEVGVVDRAVERAKPAELRAGSLDHRAVRDGERQHQRDRACGRHHAEIPEQHDRAGSEHGDANEVDPPAQQEQANRHGVVPVLGAEAPAALGPLTQLVEAAVTLDRARNLEARRAEQPDVLTEFAVDGHQHLGRKQRVVAGPRLRGYGTLLPMKLWRPIATRESRNEVLE